MRGAVVGMAILVGLIVAAAVWIWSSGADSAKEKD